MNACLRCPHCPALLLRSRWCHQQRATRTCAPCQCARRLSAPRWPLQLVELHGCKRWAFIASQMGQKGAKQCRRRWQNYLNNADAKSGGWSADEARAVFLVCNAPPHPHPRGPPSRPAASQLWRAPGRGLLGARAGRKG